MSLEMLVLLAPGLVLLAALDAFSRPGRRPGAVLYRAEAAALGAFGVAIAATLWRILEGAATVELVTPAGPLALVRLDWVSLPMLLLVTFIGWVVLRYSRVYLDGEARQGAFTGWLCLTLAMVLLLVQAAHLVLFALAWIGTSVALQRLLLFYPDRAAARRAARKKWVTARLGDAALLGAFVLLGMAWDTGNMAVIAERAAAGEGGAAVVTAAGLLALAGLLKSAQFPTHGWLTEVMETPTPVSALLHAGIVNAGGFLLIRFADVMLLAPGVLAALTMVGGFTALFAGLVMITQPAVKTSLAWSTIGQMGFMMLQCGLALFPLALLHIVAHSLYKAHAFLASGSAIEDVARIRRPGPVAVPSGRSARRSFLVALVIYALVGLVFGFADKSPQAIVLGAILVLGVAYLLAQGFADAAPRALTRRMALYSVATAVAYFGLQTGAARLTAGTLPPTPAPGPLEWFLLVLIVIGFAGVAVLQWLLPLWANHPAAASLRVHLANGLYANAFFDRLVGGWSLPGKRSTGAAHERE
mgnify:FL=1